MIYLASRQEHIHDRIEVLKEILKNNNIEYYHFFEEKNNSTLNRIFKFFKADIIYVLPCNWPIITVILGKLFRKKIITEFYFSWYDATINDWKKYSSKNIKAKILKFIDYIIMRLADKLIFLNKTEARRYMKLILNKEREYTVIPLSIKERKKVELNFCKESSKEFNVVWWGSYIPLHGVEKIIKAAKILENKNIKFYILGNSEEKSIKYKKMIINFKLNNCYIINDITFSNGKLEEFLVKKCDLALGGFGDSSKINEVITNKMLDIFSMKGICLTAPSKAIDEYFKVEESVFYCEKTPEAIAEKIMDISKKGCKDIKNISENSYKIYKKYFTKQNYEKEILKLLQE